MIIFYDVDAFSDLMPELRSDHGSLDKSFITKLSNLRSNRTDPKWPQLAYKHSCQGLKELMSSNQRMSMGMIIFNGVDAFLDLMLELRSDHGSLDKSFMTKLSNL